MADPDFNERVNMVKDAPRFQGCSIEFVSVVQLVFEAFVDESIELWIKEYERSLKQGDRPIFSALVSLTIITSVKSIDYKPRLKKVLRLLFPYINKTEWKLFDEVFSIELFGEARFRTTHCDMASYTAEQIATYLMAVGEDKYIVVHSGIGVSVFDKGQYINNPNLLDNIINNE